MPKPRKPGFQMRGSNRPARSVAVAPRAARPVGQPRKTDLIQRVASMRDEQKLSFAAIAEQVGGSTERVFYLYSQKPKLTHDRRTLPLT